MTGTLRGASHTHCHFLRLRFFFFLCGRDVLFVAHRRVHFFFVDDFCIDEEVVDGCGWLRAFREPFFDAVGFEVDGFWCGARVVLAEDLEGFAPGILVLLLDDQAIARLFLFTHAGEAEDDHRSLEFENLKLVRV